MCEKEKRKKMEMTKTEAAWNICINKRHAFIRRERKRGTDT